MVSGLFVRLGGVEHVTATVPSGRERVPEVIPVGDVLKADQFTADLAVLVHQDTARDRDPRLVGLFKHLAVGREKLRFALDVGPAELLRDVVGTGSAPVANSTRRWCLQVASRYSEPAQEHRPRRSIPGRRGGTPRGGHRHGGI